MMDALEEHIYHFLSAPLVLQEHHLMAEATVMCHHVLCHALLGIIVME
jgi:hypothetical protein